MKETSSMTHEAHVTIKNISTVAVLKVAQYPFLALTVVLIPRLMGSTSYGEYALLIAIVTVAASLIDFGAGAEMFGRFIPEFEVTQKAVTIRKFASNILGLRILIGGVTTLILYPVLSLVYGDRFSPTILIIACLIVLIREVQAVPYSLLYGLNKLGLHSSQLPLRRAFSLLLLLLLYHVFGFVGAVVATLIVDVILTVNAFLWTNDRFRLAELKFDWAYLRPFLGFDAMLYLSAVVLNVWQRSGNLLIERLTGNAQQVALFDIPNQAYIVTTTLIFTAIDTLVPIFASLLLTGREQKLKTWSATIAKYTAVLASLIFWGFVFIGPHVVPFVLGTDYTATVPNAIWLLAGLFPIAVTQLGLVFSVSYKQPWRYLGALCVSFAVFLVASFILIPLYGSAGCAMATLASSIASATVLYLCYRRQLGAAIISGLASIVAGCVFIPFLFLRKDLVTDTALVLCAMVAYLAMLLIARVVRPDEVTSVINSMRGRSATA
jgi:O-antigen/teichoic acid export membrane protein